jgi:hypothetical protein
VEHRPRAGFAVQIFGIKSHDGHDAPHPVRCGKSRRGVATIPSRRQT